MQYAPGRVGYWIVGVPPSGQMDDVSFRLANRAVGNQPCAAALEMTVSGPTLKFLADALICLGGAAMPADIGGQEVALWRPGGGGAGGAPGIARGKPPALPSPPPVAGG